MFFNPITKDFKTNKIDYITIFVYDLTVNIKNKLNLIEDFTELKKLLNL